MKNSYTIVCRGSWLSLAQAEIFKAKAQKLFPGLVINTLIKNTAGDIQQSVPLHLVEGKDFFTKEIQESLLHKEADFAIHSMKDVSNASFFNDTYYTVIDREDLRDVAIFNEGIIEKIKRGNKILIGTSSPRRSEMATSFLGKALPRFNNKLIDIEAISIRGNVDTRLRKLSTGDYDGIILAAAGLNRLLRYEPAKETIQILLNNKRVMLLPLFECPPAPGQGAIVVETNNDNKDAIQILELLKDDKNSTAIHSERRYAEQYGYGCSRPFGAFHLPINMSPFTFASGKDKDDQHFSAFDFTVDLDSAGKELFSTIDYMKHFFDYTFLPADVTDNSIKAFFIASNKAVHSDELINIISQRRVFAAGTKTWFSLADKGIWVDGCADGLGLEFFAPTLKSPLINVRQNDIRIITSTEGKSEWDKDGWKSSSSYSLIPKFSNEIKEAIVRADIIFWTSFNQYLLYKEYLKPMVQHCCPIGKTTDLFIKEGIIPFIFPGIKSFNEWKKKNITAGTGE